MLGFYLLKQGFAEIGVDLSTSDIVNPNDSNIVIYNEMPSNLPNQQDKNKSYLLLFESELIRPDNWDLEKHKHFNKIFTWNDEFVDNIKYFKINFSSELPTSIQKNIARKKKLCTLIASNKSIHHPLELYSKRVEAIHWFETNQPMDFDLYGVGWDEYKFSGPRVFRMFNKIKPLVRFLSPKFSSNRGVVSKKKPTLERYRFCICYENARDIPGYITEKIFDCFMAGCIPVYWGANNIEEYIPKNCFIDKRDFNNFKHLYEFINKMSDSQHLVYLYNIELFLNSKDSYQFTHEYFSQAVVTTILKK